jgi:hypothetical protein
MNAKSIAAILVCSLALSADALNTTFFGEDLGQGESTALTSFPNADSAEASFLSLLMGVGTEHFEGFSAGTTAPLALSFPGAGTATLTGDGFIESVPWGSTNGFGRYNVDGPGTSKYFDTNSATFAIDFSAPIAAFGFYGIDIGDFNGQLILTFLDGETQMITVPHTVNGQGGAVLFFGYINTDNPFTRVEFSDTAPGEDFFGFDRMTIGDPEQVIPEPITTALTVLGIGLLAVWRRRRWVGSN